MLCKVFEGTGESRAVLAIVEGNDTLIQDDTDISARFTDSSFTAVESLKDDVCTHGNNVGDLPWRKELHVGVRQIAIVEQAKCTHKRADLGVVCEVEQERVFLRTFIQSGKGGICKNRANSNLVGITGTAFFSVSKQGIFDIAGDRVDVPKAVIEPKAIDIIKSDPFLGGENVDPRRPRTSVQFKHSRCCLMSVHGVYGPRRTANSYPSRRMYLLY